MSGIETPYVINSGTALKSFIISEIETRYVINSGTALKSFIKSMFGPETKWNDDFDEIKGNWHRIKNTMNRILALCESDQLSGADLPLVLTSAVLELVKDLHGRMMFRFIYIGKFRQKLKMDLNTAISIIEDNLGALREIWEIRNYREKRALALHETARLHEHAEYEASWLHEDAEREAVRLHELEILRAQRKHAKRMQQCCIQ